MTLKNLARGAAQKGIQIVGTGDCLHPEWLKEIRAMKQISEGTFEMESTRFVLTTEVEDIFRVHHLLIFPTLSSVEEAMEWLKQKEVNLKSDGRPKLSMTGEEIAELAKRVDALIGPCHAFTPWTALYAYHESLSGSYGDMTHYISFLELGLSADSEYADRISELQELTFLSNSDAHGPSPNRLAREFNRFQLEEPTFEELKLAIMRRKGRKPVLNVGLPPQEGKYNETACIRCYTHYTLEEAERYRWKCPRCGKRIKKGVKDRVEQLADHRKAVHPSHRPPYLHLIPLVEIIARAIGRGVNTKGVKEKWESMIKLFGNEVNILVDIPLHELEGITDEKIVRAIEAFRTGKIVVIPGGGGKYGEIRLPWEPIEKKEKSERKAVQKGLLDF